LLVVAVEAIEFARAAHLHDVEEIQHERERDWWMAAEHAFQNRLELLDDGERTPISPLDRIALRGPAEPAEMLGVTLLDGQVSIGAIDRVHETLFLFKVAGTLHVLSALAG
jgi:hypothetical protein